MIQTVVACPCGAYHPEYNVPCNWWLRKERDEARTSLATAREELEALGSGPFVPLHQYEEVCRQRDAQRARADLVEKVTAAWEENSDCWQKEADALRAALKECVRAMELYRPIHACANRYDSELCGDGTCIWCRIDAALAHASRVLGENK